MYKISIYKMNIQRVLVLITKYNTFCIKQYTSTQREKNLVYINAQTKIC